MRVALDLSPLHRSFPVSVVRTVRPILQALGARDDVEIVGIVPPERGSLALWRQSGLPRAARRSGAQVLHSFTSAFTLTRRIPVVQTVHEAPWRHGVTENAGPVHRVWVRLGRARAAATCTPSPGVARDLAPHPRLHVMPWGVDPSFGPEPDETDALLRAALQDLPASPFVLVLGATRPKKRLDLVCAGAAIADLPIVATGAAHADMRALARRFAGLTLAGEIDDMLLPALVRAACCVAVLSTSEGFALPVIEALRSDRPVVTARDTVQSETAGEAGIDVDPTDADDVARGFREALTDDVDRNRLGRDVADGYSWTNTADALVRLWRTLT